MTILLRCLLVGLMSLGGMAILERDTSAQPADLKAAAKRHVAEGLAAQDAGRYDVAIASYNKAYELVPHPELLFNFGQAYRLKGDKTNALSYYRKYLAVDSNGRGAAQAIEQCKQIEAELRAEEAARKAEVERRAEAARKADAARIAETERSAEAARQAEEERVAAEQARQAEQAISQSPSAEENQASNESGTFTFRRKIAVALGVGSVLSLGGTYLSVKWWHEDKEEQNRNAASGEPYPPSSSWAPASIAGFAVLSIGLAGSGIYLWATGIPRSDGRATRLVPVMSGDGPGLVFSGQF